MGCFSQEGHRTGSQGRGPSRETVLHGKVLIAAVLDAESALQQKKWRLGLAFCKNDVFRSLARARGQSHRRISPPMGKRGCTKAP